MMLREKIKYKPSEMDTSANIDIDCDGFYYESYKHLLKDDDTKYQLHNYSSVSIVHKPLILNPTSKPNTFMHNAPCGGSCCENILCEKPCCVNSDESLPVYKVDSTFVKNLYGKCITLPVFDSSNTILDIKQFIMDKESTPIDQQRLIHNGRDLHNNKSLMHYDIKPHTTMYLVLRLRGGMYGESSGINGKYKRLPGFTFYDMNLDKEIKIEDYGLLHSSYYNKN